jgi:hypothetical protein
MNKRVVNFLYGLFAVVGISVTGLLAGLYLGGGLYINASTGGNWGVPVRLDNNSFVAQRANGEIRFCWVEQSDVKLDPVEYPSLEIRKNNKSVRLICR